MIRFLARWTLLLACPFLVAACSSEPGQADVDCSSATPVDLAVGQFTVLDATQTACVRFAGAASAETEYLYAALNTNGTETEKGDSASYKIQGGGVAAASVGRFSAAAGRVPRRTAAQAFHDGLRRRERELSFEPRIANPSGPRISASVVDVVPGSKRTFQVCSVTKCDQFVTANATAKVVANSVAIYVDDDAPGAGYTQTDLESLAALFDSHLYPIDTTAFGRESDLDDNGVVVVLLTQRVNELSPSCTTTGNVILGFFFGLDLLPGQANSNDGEIFYGLVPGPVAKGCTVSRDFATQNMPGVFIHEFQHMISWNQHVLMRNGPAEDTWLNEGLSHFAEELGGEQVDDSFCPAFSNCESQFNGGNIDNAFGYLDDPEASFLIEPGNSTGTLEERGANWLFVRWLADHFATTEPQGTELTRRLLETNKVGAANVAAVTGEDFSTLVGQWQLANYLTNLDGFTPSSNRLQYTTLNLRAIYLQNFQRGIFPKPYPLDPETATAGNYSRTGFLRGGSGRHVRVIQPVGSGDVNFALTDAGGNSIIATHAKPRIALARIR